MSKTILITGASTGIGKATAKLFQSKGWNVIATMRNPEKEKDLTLLENVLVTRLDVQEKDLILRAIQLGIKKFDKIDVLLNNAGYGAYGPLEDTPDEKIVRQFEVNVLGLLATTKAILPHFRENADGIVINISSVGGKITFPLGSLYHGTKFAVEGITESLSFELEAIGCQAKIVEPGATKTDFNGRSFDFNNGSCLPEYQPLVNGVISTLQKFSSATEPSVIADVIYTAATDGTNQLRYPAGGNAKNLLDQRKLLDDVTFLDGMKAQYGFQSSNPATFFSNSSGKTEGAELGEATRVDAPSADK